MSGWIVVLIAALTGGLLLAGVRGATQQLRRTHSEEQDQT